MNKIVAIVGMCGSGKSIASEIFEKEGYKKIYFGGVTINKLKEANLEINEANERYMREKLRKDYGMGAFATLLLPEITKKSKESNVILDGLYSWDELKILKDNFNENLYVLGIIVDKEIRYTRLNERSVRGLSNDEAKSRDIAEIEKLSKGGPIAFADYYILNNGDLNKYEEDLHDFIINKLGGNICQ